MSYYEDVYLKRLNRYGTDYQSRVQAQREREFEGNLLKSIYRVDFEYDGEDETENDYDSEEKVEFADDDKKSETEPFRLDRNKKPTQTLNVLGKIDISALNQNTRPKKKSKEEIIHLNLEDYNLLHLQMNQKL